jgi:hypothetical protein
MPVACADCGSGLPDDSFKAVQVHAEATHAGLPRYRIVKGVKSIEFCAECGDNVTITPRDNSGTKYDSYLDHWDEKGDHRDPRGVAEHRANIRRLEARVAELEAAAAAKVS